MFSTCILLFLETKSDKGSLNTYLITIFLHLFCSTQTHTHRIKIIKIISDDDITTTLIMINDYARETVFSEILSCIFSREAPAKYFFSDPKRI